VIADIGLHGHGLRIVERSISNFLPIMPFVLATLGLWAWLGAALSV
jgi:hypothetical protein